MWGRDRLKSKLNTTNSIKKEKKKRRRLEKLGKAKVGETKILAFFTEMFQISYINVIFLPYFQLRLNGSYI